MALRSRQGGLNGTAMDASDESLAAQAVALADTAAFEHLMRRHQQRIFYLHSRFTRDPARAEDLCQETFLRAWQKLDSFEGRGAFAGWLTRLAYNVFLQHRRRHHHERFVDSLDQPGAPAGDEALSVTDSAGDGPDLERLLAAVDTDEQRLLILSYAGGLSAAEIGEMLGRSPGTVKSQIHRAKQKIRRHFHIGVES